MTSYSAMLMFVFGIWMLLLGSLFVFLPLFAKQRWFQRIRDVALRCGFPLEQRMASALFGVAIASFSLFYFAAGVFEIRPFYWMSIFGRLGVFGTCAVLAWWHGSSANKASRPHMLLWAAVPDLVFAQATACLLLPDYLARVTFIGGTIYLVAALGIFTFPEWILSKFLVDAKPAAWTVVLGVLLLFFGSYATAAALLDYVPIIWSSILSSLVVLGFVTIVLAAQPNDAFGPAKWRLVSVVFAMFAAVLVAAVGGLRRGPSNALSAAELSQRSPGLGVTGGN